MKRDFRGTTTDLKALATMNMATLRSKYKEAFGEETTSHNAAYLRKKIAYRIQELAEGGLSERARRRIAELGANAPLTERTPRRTDQVPLVPAKRDPRLPPEGTVLRRAYAGREYEVTVVPGGFLYEGRVHVGLSTVAKAITGTIWNGFAFFGLTRKAVAA